MLNELQLATLNQQTCFTLSQFLTKGPTSNLHSQVKTQPCTKSSHGTVVTSHTVLLFFFHFPFHSSVYKRSMPFSSPPYSPLEFWVMFDSFRKKVSQTQEPCPQRAPERTWAWFFQVLSFPRTLHLRFVNSLMLIISGMFDKRNQNHYLPKLGGKKHPMSLSLNKINLYLSWYTAISKMYFLWLLILCMFTRKI